MSTVPVSTTSGPCSDAVTFANFLLSSALWTSASMPPASQFAALAPTPNQSDALSTATPAANRLSLLNLNIRSSFPTENSTPTRDADSDASVLDADLRRRDQCFRSRFSNCGSPYRYRLRIL